ncbi:MAG: hypothetical protein PHQ01_02145 [Candidatus Pacebacteria bacterium]|nr:hypothetical protein [Candidatus Paceibacterota bacterium]
MTDINKINIIIDTGIFDSKNIGHPLMESAFIDLIIKLRDLLYKSEKLGKRINFKEDVIILKDDSGKEVVKDITDAVKYVRDAACHINSLNHTLNKNIVFTFNITHGKVNLMSMPGMTLTSDYEDDICFFYGEQKLYLNRHIVRAYEEAKNFLRSLMV